MNIPEWLETASTPVFPPEQQNILGLCHCLLACLQNYREHEKEKIYLNSTNFTKTHICTWTCMYLVHTNAAYSIRVIVNVETHLKLFWVSHLRQLMLPFAAAKWTGVTPFCARSNAEQPSDSTSQTTTERCPNRAAVGMRQSVPSDLKQCNPLSLRCQFKLN